MSIFDDIAMVCSEFNDSWVIESIEAVERLEELRQQYNALTPDWTSAPPWAQWYVIGANGQCYWTSSEPLVVENRWSLSGSIRESFIGASLPFGIDWRLCKWQRPEAQT